MIARRKPTPSYLLHSPPQTIRAREPSGPIPPAPGSKNSRPDRSIHPSPGPRSPDCSSNSKPHARTNPDGATVNEVLLAFITFAGTHYRRADGTTTNELDEYKLVSRHVRELYGDRTAAEFGPLALKAPVAGVTSDGQYSVRKAVAKALPSSPHPLRPFHDLREAARPI